MWPELESEKKKKKNCVKFIQAEEDVKVILISIT